MGRRKIEIQPITHERNRSVTFLKRKNGLFKKAYELGVLCSVDVAVIIFEARPGHEVKLHEYASSDIRNIVHRQSMHQGDTDLKVPADFSGSANKFDDGGDVDGDDDNGDEEEDLPVAKPSRRRGQSALTFPTSNDDHIIPLPPPPPPPAHRLHPESAGGALLSVANDRVSNMRDLHPPRPNKRHRNARSRSPSEDTLMPALPAMNSDWGLSQDNHGSGRYGRNARHLHNPPPPGISHQQQEHQYHSMHQQQHSGHGFQYSPLFPVPNQVSPAPAFIPLQDFGPSRSLPPFSGSRSGGSGGAEGGSGYADLHQRMRPSDPPGYDPAPYTPNTNSMTRHSEHHHQHHQQHQQQPLLSHPPPPPPSPPSGSHRREDRGADGLFGSLLEADERNRQRSGPGGAGGVLDWPMHDGLTLPGRSGTSGPGPTSPRSSLDGPGISNPTNGSDSWFDFLSRSNAVNESHSNSNRRSSSSTWPKNSDMNARHKAGEDTFEGRKESAVRGEVRIGQDGVDPGNPILLSPKERTGEGDATRTGQADDHATRSDEEKP